MNPPPEPVLGDMCIVSRETPPQRPCTWGHMSTIFRVNPLDPGPGVTFPVSSVISLHKHCIWAHTSTVSSVTPPPTLSNWDHMSTVQGNPASQAVYLESFTVSMVTSSQAMHLGSHFQSQGDPTSESLHLESHVHSPQGLPLPDPVPGVTHPQSPW